MPRIHLLDEMTANQIAAGEVIERPASVIKELVENALDAGAGNISVELRDGGLNSITVTDDGCGMSREDSLLAVKRHATSKMQAIEDLNSLHTLGFRGEALPSITAVSKTELITRESLQEYGTRIKLAGNEIVSTEDAGTAVGTIVNVSDLFFNTPARKKFMRSPAYEAGLIHELMINYSLAHPSINFRLFNQGKEVLNTRGINSIPDLVELFYGVEAREALIECHNNILHGSINAFISAPFYHRANRKAIHFVINSRRVLSKELLKALDEAYEQLLPRGRFPLAVIHLQLDPSIIDVNVHPAKLEIRFRELVFVRDFLDNLKQSLANSRAVKGYSAGFILPQQVVKEDNHVLHSPPQTQTLNKTPSAGQEVFKNFYTWDRPASQNTRINEVDYEDKTRLKDDVPRDETEKLPDLRIIGQLNNTFILAEGEKGLYFIDQHAAHERILFEQLIGQASSGSEDSQLIIEPVTLQLTSLEEEVIIEHILSLADLGIVLEHFGPRSYLLRAVPAAYQGDPKELFYFLLEKLTGKTYKISLADIKKDLLVMASCKAAIKAGQKLSPQAMHKLLTDLYATNIALTCPHGRPVVYFISNEDIYKAFRRPMKG